MARLGQEAARWWAAAGAEVTHNGTLAVTLTRDRRELDAFARRVPGGRMLDRAGLAELEPDLAGRFGPRAVRGG